MDTAILKYRVFGRNLYCIRLMRLYGRYFVGGAAISVEEFRTADFRRNVALKCAVLFR